MRRKGATLDGLLLLDKPGGITSNAALQQARRLLGAAKAGHTGTLDPLATGLLAVCFGEATKFSSLLLDADKTYLATVKLGATTTTGDAEGEVIFRGDVGAVSVAQIEAVLAGLIGTQEQVPPMFSALKHLGRPLYEYARAGATVARAGRQITVHDLSVLRVEPDMATIRLRVSKGTYIRVIAQEIGERLGCGAHLSGLRREAIGTWNVEAAVSFETLAELTGDQRRGLLRPVDGFLEGLPRIDLDAAAASALCQGQSVSAGPMTDAGLVRVYGADGAFLGLGQIEDSGRVAPRRLLSTQGAGVPLRAA